MLVGDVSAADPALPQTKEIINQAFPEEQGWGVAWLEPMLGKERERAARQSLFHLLVAEENPGNTAVGLAAAVYYHQGRPGGAASIGFLDYLAVDEVKRGQGIGTHPYRAALEVMEMDARRAGERFWGMALDVDPVEIAADEETRMICQRRLDFYGRLGAHVVSGIDFVEPAEEEGQPEEHTILLYHLVSRDIERRELASFLYELVFGLAESHPLVRRALRAVPLQAKKV